MSIADLKAAKYRNQRKRMLALLESVANDTGNPCQTAQQIARDALAFTYQSETHLPSRRQIATVLSVARQFPPCFCGKTAHYRVGLTGYCDKHYQRGVNRKRHVDQDLRARKHAYFQKDVMARDYQDLQNGTAKNSGRIERANVLKK